MPVSPYLQWQIPAPRAYPVKMSGDRLVSPGDGLAPKQVTVSANSLASKLGLDVTIDLVFLCVVVVYSNV